MPFQHYLPATYLAFFSYDNSGSRRERRLYIGDRYSKKIFVDKTGNICGINNIYKSTLVEGLDIDLSWNYYEAELDLAINLLLNRNISALAWIKVLVPFVTGLLIRGPDYSERYENRINNLEVNGERMDINVARMFELQRLLPIIVTAKWVVLETSGLPELITNDLGYIPFGNPRKKEIGMAIPIGTKNILMITPQIYSWIAHYFNGEWKPNIEYGYLDIGDPTSFNQMMGHYSQRFIFGSNKKLIYGNLQGPNNIERPLEPFELGFPGQYGINHEMTWYKLVDIFSKKNIQNFSHVLLDLRKIPKSSNMIILPLVYGSIY